MVGKNAVKRVEGTGLKMCLRVADTELHQPITGGQFRAITLDTLSVLSPPADGWIAVANTLRSLVADIGTAARTDDRKWLQNNDSELSSYPSMPAWLRTRCGN